ncbi:MAG TPA: hypothetical protein VN748_13570 [Pseudonocardiaceae bacterium]|nr:hypothetical protein [Pseudonocardiaceae bacterium]
MLEERYHRAAVKLRGCVDIVGVADGDQFAPAGAICEVLNQVAAEYAEGVGGGVRFGGDGRPSCGAKEIEEATWIPLILDRRSKASVRPAFAARDLLRQGR